MITSTMHPRIPVSRKIVLNHHGAGNKKSSPSLMYMVVNLAAKNTRNTTNTCLPIRNLSTLSPVQAEWNNDKLDIDCTYLLLPTLLIWLLSKWYMSVTKLLGYIRFLHNITFSGLGTGPRIFSSIHVLKYALGTASPQPWGLPGAYPQQSFLWKVSLCSCCEWCRKLAHRFVLKQTYPSVQ